MVSSGWTVHWPLADFAKPGWKCGGWCRNTRTLVNSTQEMTQNTCNTEHKTQRDNFVGQDLCAGLNHTHTTMMGQCQMTSHSDHMTRDGDEQAWDHTALLQTWMTTTVWRGTCHVIPLLLSLLHRVFICATPLPTVFMSIILVLYGFYCFADSVSLPILVPFFCSLLLLKIVWKSCI
jgi:hypothetical protein